MKPGYKTSEFLLALLVAGIGAIASGGILVPGSKAAQIVGLASVTLSSMFYAYTRMRIKIAHAPDGSVSGVTIEGDGEANVTNVTNVAPPAERATTEPKGFARHDLLLLLGCSALVLLLAPLSSCSWFKGEAQHDVGKLIDCAAGQLGSTVRELRPMVDDVLIESITGDAKLDQDRILDVTKNFASDVGMCLFADAVTRALKPVSEDPQAPRASPLVADPTSLRCMFNVVRAKHAPGKQYKTEAGTL